MDLASEMLARPSVMSTTMHRPMSPPWGGRRGEGGGRAGLVQTWVHLRAKRRCMPKAPNPLPAGLQLVVRGLARPPVAPAPSGRPRPPHLHRLRAEAHSQREAVRQGRAAAAGQGVQAAARHGDRLGRRQQHLGLRAQGLGDDALPALLCLPAGRMPGPPSGAAGPATQGCRCTAALSLALRAARAWPPSPTPARPPCRRRRG